jgi:YaiO family outer membrane protein
MKSRSLLYIFLLTCVINQGVLAQGEEWKTLSPDLIFAEAQKKVAAEHHDQARVMLEFLVTKQPAYNDARILLARIYAWDKNYDTARKELQRVINESPQHQDALLALIDVEIWDQKYSEALILVESLNNEAKLSDDIRYKKALCLSEMDRNEESLVILNQLLGVNPSDQRASELLKKIKSDKFKHTAGIAYNVDFFSRAYDPAQYASAQLSRLNAWGTGIIKLNYAYRFHTSGLQPEIDLYPKILKGVYGYLNYGYSSSLLFPKQRIGAEIFSRVGKGGEISAGARYLQFNTHSPVTIFTGSVGYYWSNYWASTRAFIAPNGNQKTTVSALVFLRRYFKDKDNYLSLITSFGFSPDERRLQTSSGLSSDGIYRLFSSRIGLAWSKTFGNDFILVTNFDFTRQELSFEKNEDLLISSGGITLKKRF